MWWSRTLGLIWSTDSNYLKLNVIDVEENHRSMAIEIIKSGGQILFCIAVYSPVYPNSDVSEEKKIYCVLLLKMEYQLNIVVTKMFPLLLLEMLTLISLY